ncbi:MAG: TonB-dependent receptor, partial [Caldilineaceae bacterium]
QFAIAKQLDPKDPTAYFYDAIQKQTTNRPVEALQEMQTAIELNDNRAVYRSRLLLDSDRAARGASLANIYNDLGFQQLGLVEGWKSVNTDPTSSAAHRFLADTYAVLPRHEIARVSELLQSQLLDPLNAAPLQPLLAESNLFLISSLGPAAVGFNEFNELFTRNGLNFLASGLVGGNNTRAGQAIVSGVQDKVSFSVGGFRFDTDGFRPNAYQETTLANVFLQMELSPDTSIQAEYRYKDANQGDTQLRFFPDEYFPGQDLRERTSSYRLGLRRNLSANSILLGSLVYVDGEYGADQDPVPSAYTALGLASLEGDEPQDALSAEIQNLYRAAKFDLTSGVGYFNRNSSATLTTKTILPPPFDSLQETGSTDIEHANAYVYSNVRLLKNLTATLGLSADFTGDTSESLQKTANDDNQYNPKFGLMWTPLTNTLVRLAAFRVQKRPVIANQTLEPTQVAGFNQFYDDYNNTVSRRYGAAIDQTFSSSLYGGVEVSRRDLDVPLTGINIETGDPVYSTVDWQEDLARAYLFWTPKSWLALSLDYRFERFERDAQLTDGVKDADTHRLGLGIRAFLPSGWSFGVNPAYYHQKGTFESVTQLPIPEPILSKGDDSFWLVDGALSYRLPKRYGFISVGVQNMFDQNFRYFDTDYKNTALQPSRIFFTSLSLALP